MQMTFVSILGFLLYLSFATISTSAQETFRGIVPLVTTKMEVEKKLGKPDEYGRYELDEGTVRVYYRKTACDKSDTNCLCGVPVDTVLEVVVQPQTDVKIVDLKLDPNLWKRSAVTGGHVPGLEVYINHKAGVTFEVDMNDGIVREIRYEVTAETCRKLGEQLARPQP
jgi:hypothetical protein